MSCDDLILLVLPVGLLRSIQVKAPFLLKLYILLNFLGLGFLVNWALKRIPLTLRVNCRHGGKTRIMWMEWRFKGRLIYRVRMVLCDKCRFT